MRAPSSDHTGGPNTPCRTSVSGADNTPSVDSRQICWWETHASWEPSGDQRGIVPSDSSRFSLVPETSQIDERERSATWSSTLTTYAMQDPSGDGCASLAERKAKMSSGWRGLIPGPRVAIAPARD